MLVETTPKLDFSDVLIKPKRSVLESREDVNLCRTFKTRYGAVLSGVPIIASNMATGNFNMLDVFAKSRMFVAVAKHHNEEWVRVIKEWDDSTCYGRIGYGFYTIGLNDNELANLISFYSMVKSLGKTWEGRPLEDAVKICIDIANGYTERFSGFVNKVRGQFPKNIIVAGNVCTPEMVQELILSGADFVKCGIGGGSHCTTRYKTGVGYPMVSMSIECAEAAHGLNAGIVADGGIKVPGDIAKAFCANADMVMIGGLLSGTDECEGDVFTKKFFTNEAEPVTGADGTVVSYRQKIIEKKFKTFYGMSSALAQEKHFGGVKDYRTSEGIATDVECTGPVQRIVDDILGGLRSACTYIGAKEMKNMGKCGSFIMVNHQH